MIIAETLVIAVLGALWRRWFGGWPSIPEARLPKLAAALGLGLWATAPLPWQIGLPLAGLMTAYWVPGHDLQGWALRQWLLRYGPVGAYWWAANRFAFPFRVHYNKALDGPNAFAELAAGATMYGALALVARLV